MGIPGQSHIMRQRGFIWGWVVGSATKHNPLPKQPLLLQLTLHFSWSQIILPGSFSVQKQPQRLFKVICRSVSPFAQHNERKQRGISHLYFEVASRISWYIGGSFQIKSVKEGKEVQSEQGQTKCLHHWNHKRIWQLQKHTFVDQWGALCSTYRPSPLNNIGGS